MAIIALITREIQQNTDRSMWLDCEVISPVISNFNCTQKFDPEYSTFVFFTAHYKFNSQISYVFSSFLTTRHEEKWNEQCIQHKETHIKILSVQKFVINIKTLWKSAKQRVWVFYLQAVYFLALSWTCTHEHMHHMDQWSN